MPLIRYALIDTSKTPQTVVDIVEINDEPDMPDHETLIVTEPFHEVQSNEADIGWVWNGKKLKAS